MAKQRIMGLDASTTTIGLAVIEIDNGKIKLIHNEFYKPPKKGDLFERLNEVRDFITDRIKTHKPDEVALEDVILFMMGASTATTTTSLAVLNRTVGLAAMNTLGKSPHLFNVMKIRHALKLTPTLPPKEEIPELVAKHLGIDFPYVYNTRSGKLVVENYDMADAIAVALVYAKIGPPEPPKKKVRKKSKK